MSTGSNSSCNFTIVDCRDGEKQYDLERDAGAETEAGSVSNPDVLISEKPDRCLPIEAREMEALEASVTKQPPLEPAVSPIVEHGTTSTSYAEAEIISWEGPDDPQNPTNWRIGSKWAATIIVSCFTFISPVSSSMIAPALSDIVDEFGIKSAVQSQMMLSVFVLAYAIGPLFLAPLSEIHGRVPVLQVANLFYLVWNTACGFCRSQSQMVAFRFLAGLGSSAPLAIGGGVLSDCWRAEERGKAMAIYYMAPVLGPAIGPIAGGFITQNLNWRWVFHITSIADAVVQVIGLLWLRETYHPKLLEVKTQRLREETGNANLRSRYHDGRDFRTVLITALVRPLRLIATQPIIQMLSLYMTYLYGLIYLVISILPQIFDRVYHQSEGIGGLHYIAMGLGFILGTQICLPLSDRIYRYLKAHGGDIDRPEYRVPIMVPFSLVMPAGLFCLGWAAQSEAHWAVTDLGVLMFSIGMIVGNYSVQSYLVDAYTRYAASALAGVTALRSFAGFAFPLVAPYMFSALNYGWGGSLLAFVGLGIGIPSPFILWFWGEKIRARSTYAAGHYYAG